MQIDQLADLVSMHQAGAHQRSRNKSIPAVPTTGLRVTTMHTSTEQQPVVGPQIVWQIESKPELSAPSL